MAQSRERLQRIFQKAPWSIAAVTMAYLIRVANDQYMSVSAAAAAAAAT
jgi:hypothetical protein